MNLKNRKNAFFKNRFFGFILKKCLIWIKNRLIWNILPNLEFEILIFFKKVITVLFFETSVFYKKCLIWIKNRLIWNILPNLESPNLHSKNRLIWNIFA